MPQLMPFYWFSSLFMVVMILMTVIIIYSVKNIENVNLMISSSSKMSEFNLLW